MCPYQIEGMGTADVRRVCPPEHMYDLYLSDEVRGAVGFDAMDALIQGLHAIPRDLALFTKAPGGTFVRHGEPDWTLVYACRNVLKDADSAFPSAPR